MFPLTFWGVARPQLGLFWVSRHPQWPRIHYTVWRLVNVGVMWGSGVSILGSLWALIPRLGSTDIEPTSAFPSPQTLCTIVLCHNNNNNLIYIAPACRMTSEALYQVPQKKTEK